MAKERTAQQHTDAKESLFTRFQACIKVVGVGGGGGNAVNRMMEVGVESVDFIAMNTDAQVLVQSRAPIKLQLGPTVCKGLGAGGDANVGRSAAEESRQEIRKVLEGADMVFITAGMGGGTGTGGAPIVAEIAMELGALTVAVVTRPFSFEGPRRARVAEEGIRNLRSQVDALIVIDNNRVIDITEHGTGMTEAYRKADDILRYGVQGIADIIQKPGLINVDFADVRAVLRGAGTALMGIGKGTGEKGFLQAVQEASTSKLMESSIEGALGLLVNITSSEDLPPAVFKEGMDYLHQLIDPEKCLFIFGHVINPEMKDMVQVTLVATGFPEHTSQPKAVVRTTEEHPLTQRAPVNPSPASRNETPTRVVPNQPEVRPTRTPRSDELDLPAFLRRRGG